MKVVACELPIVPFSAFTSNTNNRNGASDLHVIPKYEGDQEQMSG